MKLSTIFPVKTRREPYSSLRVLDEINRTMSRSRDESIGFAIGALRMTVNQTSKLTNLTEFFPSVRLIHVPVRAS